MAEPPARLPAGSELVAGEREVGHAVDRLAASLQPYVDEGDCILLAVMLGGMLPAGWLAGRLTGDFVLDYCHVTRYQGGEQGGEPVWHQSPRQNPRGRSVLVIDDIFDEGITLDYVRRQCLAAGAVQVVSATLVRKRHSRAVAPCPDFFGLEVPDRYVFGCGMDYRDRWRHLPAIHALPATQANGTEDQ